MEAVGKPETSLLQREIVRISVEVAVARSRPSGSGKYSPEENRGEKEN